jgi:hypothetical protein
VVAIETGDQTETKTAEKKVENDKEIPTEAVTSGDMKKIAETPEISNGTPADRKEEEKKKESDIEDGEDSDEEPDIDIARRILEDSAKLAGRFGTFKYFLARTNIQQLIVLTLKRVPLKRRNKR